VIRQRLGLIVIDECHLLLSWRMFRKSYSTLASTIHQQQWNVPIVALTATLIHSDTVTIMNELKI
jgi:superfamily II DNA helicase RecQ